MKFLLNPFKMHDRDRSSAALQENVVVSLADAPRYAGTRNVEKSDSGFAEQGKEISLREGGSTVDALEVLRAEIESAVVAAGGGLDSVFDRKSLVVNRALQDIGMGRYNWQLFVLCGFGWFADNLWLQGLAVILTSIQREFSVDDLHIGYTTTALFIGLCIGASVWGVLSDIIGRRIAFNTTLCIAGIFGLAVGGAPTWIGTAALFACLGTGVGGNLPVDGALFLEFLPGESGNLLMMLSIWWPVGQLVASLIAWALIPNFSCSAEIAQAGLCTREQNMGWRYFTFTIGALTFIMFVGRFFCFHLYESPKFHLSRGKDEEAVATVHGVAAKNGSKTWLTVEILRDLGGEPAAAAAGAVSGNSGLSTVEIVKRTLGKFSTQRIKPLFATRELAWTTVLIWYCWAAIGMGYPLFNAFLPLYLTKDGGEGGGAKPNSVVYRNYAITSIVGVPGSIIACYTVDLPHIGRKGTMAISTLLSGIFLFLFTISTTSTYQLTFSSLEALFQNAMYGGLYMYTPEVFPSHFRGTATGLASFINRLTGLCAPIIATNTLAVDPRVPVYVSGALLISAFLAMMFLPIETRGKEKL